MPSLEMAFVQLITRINAPPKLAVFVFSRRYDGRAASGRWRFSSFVVESDIRTGLQKAIVSISNKLSLGELLPAYIIPAIFAPVGCKPVTGTGTLDRRQLKLAIHSRIESFHGYTQSPENTESGGKIALAERGLAELWSTVLKIENSSLSNSFLESSGKATGRKEESVVVVFHELCTIFTWRPGNIEMLER